MELDKIVVLKAEIFDLQVQFGTIRNKMNKKLKELDRLIGNNGRLSKRVLQEDAPEGETPPVRG